MEDWPKEGGMGALWRRRSLRWPSKGLVDLIGGGVSRYMWGNSKLGDENEHDPCGEWEGREGQSLIQRPLGVREQRQRCGQVMALYLAVWLRILACFIGLSLLFFFS